MKHFSSIAIRIFIVATFSLLTLTASAQKFKKPLTSPRDRILSSEARWNVGILGSANFSTWLHIHSAEASNWSLKHYSPRFLDTISLDTISSSLGFSAGVAVEYRVKNNLSVGLNAIYAQHNVLLGFVDDHFPYAWNGNSIDFIQREKTLEINYQTIEVYIPITYYTTLGGSKNVTPYAFVAPRFSYVLPFDTLYIAHTSTYTQENTVLSHTNNVVEVNPSTFRRFNVGLTLGAGYMFRINFTNYYSLVKFDISANMNGISTFKKGEVVNNEFNHLRHSADAHATLTFMLPIKKQLKGACMTWGEYD